MFEAIAVRSHTILLNEDISGGLNFLFSNQPPPDVLEQVIDRTLDVEPERMGTSLRKPAKFYRCDRRVLRGVLLCLFRYIIFQGEKQPFLMNINIVIVA
ncbi:hypothetical protein I4U23_020010 [Adineta vaga]|nr:hypothetical protein I4U23_020010 [Adineta vaga]